MSFKKLLGALLALQLGVPPIIWGADPLPTSVPNQVLVRYKPGRFAQGRASVFRQFATQAKSEIKPLDMELLQTPEGETQDAFIQKLENNSDVLYAQPNYIYRAVVFPDDDPDDDHFDDNNPNTTTDQYYLHSSTDASIHNVTGSINAGQAWNLTLGSATTVVAVIDTGVTLTHPDLVNKLWNNPSNPSNHGQTFEVNYDGDSDCTEYIYYRGDPVGQEQCASTNPTDDNTGTFHGTRVSGIIAAETNNNLDIAGVCPNCKIMALKGLSSDGGGTDESIAQAIVYAANNGASVINMSLGGPGDSPSMEDAVNYAIQRNVVVVAASGNGTATSLSCGVPQTAFVCSVNYPAAFAGVIAVGSVNSCDNLSSFSCTGQGMDLVAPGEGIRSTVSPSGSSAGVNGTSFATPMVAGVAGLIRSLFPTMPVQDVMRYIIYNTDDQGPAGYDTGYGFGRLNAYKAVLAAIGQTPFISNPLYPGETFPYPNPFNPTLGQNLTIALPQSLGSEEIEIQIFTISGERVKTLTDTNAWDGKNEEGNYVGSGLYIYYAKTAAGNIKGKLTILK